MTEAAPKKKFNFGSNAVKCAQCNTSVYANDSQVQIDALVYHSACAKCSECKCQINVSNWRKDGTTLYCRTHYDKKFREEGKLLGSEKFAGPKGSTGGSTKFGNTIKCAQCDTAVYPNDPQFQIDGLSYHNSCAKCSECKCQINVSNYRKDGSTLYCRTHYDKKIREEGKLLGSEKFSGPKGTGSASSSNALKCAVCETAVYPNDPQFQIDGLSYHNSCAKCSECKCQINVYNYRKDGSTLYCRTHYDKKIREEGKLLGSEKFSGPKGTGSASSSNALKCAVCETAVYPNDPQVQLDSLVYHNSCAKCTECRCQITVSNYRKDGSTLYCRTHYDKKIREEGKLLGSEKFSGPKGTGSASSSNALKCAVCETAVYPNDPQVQLDSLVYHNSCAKCTECRCQITVSNYRKDGSTLYCRTHYDKKFREEGRLLGSEKFSKQSSKCFSAGGYVTKSDSHVSESNNEPEVAPGDTKEPEVEESPEEVKEADVEEAPEEVKEPEVEAAPADVKEAEEEAASEVVKETEVETAHEEVKAVDVEEAEVEAATEEVMKPEVESAPEDIKDAEVDAAPEEVKEAEVEAASEEVKDAEVEATSEEVKEAEVEVASDEVKEAELEVASDEVKGEEVEASSEEVKEAEVDAAPEEVKEAELEAASDEGKDAELEAATDEGNEAEVDAAPEEVKGTESVEVDDVAVNVGEEVPPGSTEHEDDAVGV